MKCSRVKAKLLQSHWCFPQLIKAAENHTVGLDEGGKGIGDNTSISSSSGFGGAAGFRAPQALFHSCVCSSNSRGPYQLCTHICIHRTLFLLLYFHLQSAAQNRDTFSS